MVDCRNPLESLKRVRHAGDSPRGYKDLRRQTVSSTPDRIIPILPNVTMDRMGIGDRSGVTSGGT